jgi:hypothetical protein
VVKTGPYTALAVAATTTVAAPVQAVIVAAVVEVAAAGLYRTVSVFMENRFFFMAALSMCLIANSLPSSKDLPRNTCTLGTQQQGVQVA